VTTCRRLSFLSPLMMILMLLGLPTHARAGDLDSPSAPGATSSYTLEDVYKRLEAGTAGAPSTFTEPAAGPTVGTMHTLNEIMGKAPASDNANGAAASDVLSGKTFWGLRTGGWGPQTGSLTTQTPDNTTVSQPAGYYAAFNLSTVDANLATANIRSGVSIFGVGGDANVVNTGSGDAVAGDMLVGKKAWVDGGEVTGTAAAGADVNGADGSKSFTIPDGLYSGSKTATANDADLAAGNIASGVQILGVTGTAVVATGNAVAGDVLTGKTFSNAGGSGIPGDMANNGNGGTITPGTSDHNIAAGYWATPNTVSGDASLVTGNIRSGVSIFSVPGKTEVVDTSTGDAVAPDILKDKKAWVDGTEVTGTRYGGCTCSGTLVGTRWCDNGDGTVTDLLGYNGKGKCLVWLKDASWGGQKAWRVNVVDSYDDAHTRAGILKSEEGGLSDGSVEGEWRLPTKEELYGLANGTDAVRWDSMQAFTGVQSFGYWSSSTYAGRTDYAWYVFFSQVGGGSKSGSYYVWPVRGGQ